MINALKNWIGGRAELRARLEVANIAVDTLQCIIDAMEKNAESAFDLHRRRHYELVATTAKSERYEAALNQIIALETPGANATVRKMARVAREAVAKVRAEVVA